MFKRSSLAARMFAVVITAGAVTPANVAMAHRAVTVGVASTSVPELVACPVEGPSEFVDSWGDARSGGRRHEGIDMAASRGTPVSAVADGDAEFKRSGLGGNAIWLVTESGDRFYYAHLDAWEGQSRSVRAGEVIGYVGSTGNAGGNHLHFEIRRDDRAINPFPAVSRSCSGGELPTASAPSRS
jgi:murein DD-endopeptidase MepM/ murein hydrolase activator NlpD